MQNPMALCAGVDLVLAQIIRTDKSDAEKSHAVERLHAKLEGLIVAAYADGNENDAQAYRTALHHLISKTEDMY